MEYLNKEGLQRLWSKIKETSKQTYSTSSEQVIGTWLGKPLYRKTVNCGQPTLSNGSSTSIAHNIANIENVVSYKGILLNNAGGNYMLPYVNRTANTSITNVNRTNIAVQTYNEGWGGHSLYVTIEYTKTTDS